MMRAPQPGHTQGETDALGNCRARLLPLVLNRFVQMFLAGVVDRQGDADRGALAQGAGDVGAAAQGGDDGVHHRQADARPPHRIAALEELLLDLAQVLGGDAAALVPDGDGDRVALVDEKGTYLTPCIVAAVLLDYLIKNKKLKGKVVETFSMGYLLKRIARKYDMLFEEVGIGFKNVAERMFLDDVAFGVEESGGYAWKGSVPDRDGLLVALTFLEIMAVTGKKASQLCEDVTEEYGASVYLRKDYPITKPMDKAAVVEKMRKKLPKKVNGHKIAEMYTTDGLKIILDNDEWVLIRPSGTEPLLRVYAEAALKKDTQALLDFGAKIVGPYLK